MAYLSFHLALDTNAPHTLSLSPYEASARTDPPPRLGSRVGHERSPPRSWGSNMARMSTSERVPKPMQATFDAIVALTDAFCHAHLDEEYTQLTRQATAALCRKRPSPLATGPLKTWACGIVYALGSVNFLFDKSQTPTMRAVDLCAGFGVSQSTGSAKAKVVRDALGMGQMDPQWYRPSKMEDNPLAWMIMVDGFVVDVRHMSRAVQEMAYEKGLIPSIPGEK